jgi:large subunit ribosomal protein L6e
MPGPQQAGGKKKEKAHAPRNALLPGGVMRFSRARMYQVKAVYKKKKFQAKKVQHVREGAIKKKTIGGAKNGGERIVKLKREPRALDSEKTRRAKKPRNKKPFSQHRRHLRSTLTPGTVVIMLAGRHKGKHAVFLKQLESGLLLVTGPMKLNSCPLRRINQIYVIATKTKLDMGKVKIGDHLNDTYFKRVKRDRRRHAKGEEGNIFAKKSEEYTVSDQRKKDQIDIDRQLMDVIRHHKDKKLLFGYLGSTFSLRKNQYPHQMVF